MTFHSLPPLSLYIHIPWCEKKCPYCDFNSHAQKSTLPEATYIDALLEDLNQELPQVWGRRVHTIFIGGGTPSLFTPESMDRLLSGIRARLQCAPGAEITIEANPGSSEVQKFSEFLSAGINRVSIGVQSFNNDHLISLGRVHNAQESLNAVNAAQKAGFENINLDLMFGLPGQSLADALQDISTAIEQGATHVSHYQLTIEPNTGFAHRPPPLPDDEALWSMQTQAQNLLCEASYQQYEVSAYAKSNYQSKHNLNYWSFGDYLGIGAGAHSKITFADRIMRCWKVKHPDEYLQFAATEKRIRDQQSLSPASARFEFMLNALRLREPVSVSLFQQRTGQPIANILPILTKAQDDSLLEFNHREIKTTDLGYRFLNDLLQQFLPESEAVNS